MDQMKDEFLAGAKVKKIDVGIAERFLICVINLRSMGLINRIVRPMPWCRIKRLI